MKCIYIASPYSVGSKIRNVNRQIDAGEVLLKLGYCPIIPLYSHYQNKRHPHDYETWMQLDFAKIW